MPNPTAPLHMVQMQMSSRDLARSARQQKIPSSSGDTGYVLHGQLAALFGDMAPKPFCAIERRGSVTVLGYSGVDQSALQEQVSHFADPLDARALRDLASKTMPSEWTPGKRLGFEVRVCPTKRMRSKEQDAYLSAIQRLEANEEEPSREQVYRQWLQRKLDGIAELKTCGLERFQLVDLFRRHQKPSAGRRVQSKPRFPEAVLKGELSVIDGNAFGRILANGVGRHRAFGFGMLLLRAPSRI